jgi:uncharacterized damage-inducible protein DinB
MSEQAFPALDIVGPWSRLNDELIKLVEYVPVDKLNWSPRPELWNFRGILLHIAQARDGWMGGTVGDGDPAPSVYQTTRSKAEVQREFRRTWERVARFLADPAALSRTYQTDEDGRQSTGHWIAYHLLEHDVHHRANIFDYLALLGIATPEVGTP